MPNVLYVSFLSKKRHVTVRVDVQVQASLPSLALPSSQQGQALAARILPLPSEKIEITMLALKMLSEHTYQKLP